MARIPTLSARHPIVGNDGLPTSLFIDFIARFVSASEAGTVTTSDAAVSSPTYAVAQDAGTAHARVSTPYEASGSERVATAYSAPAQAVRVSTTY
jgi:hypothetical protein